MFFSPPNLAVLVLFAQPASETVPRLDVEPSCRAAARVGDNLDALCEWQRCTALSAQGAASYVGLLECLPKAREAREIEKTP